MDKSESINELAVALSKAQSEIENATKNSVNPHFKNRYADLASVLEESRKTLSKYGLSIAQTTKTEGADIILVTTLMHTSGQWIQSLLPLILGKNDMQGLGSAMTYGRRYSIAALVGIGQEDDDGEASVQRHSESSEKPKCEHVWMNSKYNPGQQFCSKCRATKEV